jgi:hypothetical protein
MASAEIQSVDCSIPHNGTSALIRSSDDDRHAGNGSAAQVGDEPERNFIIAAWALLSLGAAAIRAARLIPWWLFAVVLLLVLARHS